MKNIFLVLFLICYASCIEQETSHTPYNCSYLLEFKIKDSISYGTGFLIADKLKDETRYYMVTARHVIGTLDNQKNLILKSPIIKILRNNNLKNREYALYSMNLERMLYNGFVMWNKEYDLAMILIGIERDGKQYEANVSESMSFFSYNATRWYALPKEIIIDPKSISAGANVFICGYPISIGLRESKQFDYNKPLVRKGIISGFYPEKKTIILDVASYGGFSGSPVFFNHNNNMKVIGLVIERIPYVEKDSRDKDNSGFSVAISSELILEMLVDFNKMRDTIGIKVYERN